MEHLVQGVRKAVANANWYGALALALALPDICGSLETQQTSKKRYVAWFNSNLSSTYGSYLSGEDCYALRCAYLHEGDFDIQGQSARKVLERFTFMMPAPNIRLHRIQVNQRLALQVDLFCEEICAAVESWLVKARTDATIRQSIDSLPQIQQLPGNGFKITGQGDVVELTDAEREESRKEWERRARGDTA